MLAITGARAGAKTFRTHVRRLGYCLLLFVWFGSPCAQALGLGDLRVQSGLGQPLRASIAISGERADAILPLCVKARVVNLEGTLVSTLNVGLNQEGNGPALVLTSQISLDEPALTVLLDVACEANIHRDYAVLLDPVEVPPARSVARAASESAAARTQARPAAAGPVATRDSGLTRRLSRESRRSARSVLKLEASDLSAVLSGNKEVPDKNGMHPNPAQGNPEPSGTARLQLQLSRRLRNDTSSVASAAQEVFSDTVRQQQNQAAFLELGRVELKLMQQQIIAMEAELAQLKQSAVPQPVVAQSDVLPTDVPQTSVELPEPVAALPVNHAPAPTAIQTDHRTQQWLVGLALILLVCLLAIIWLLWRLLQLRTSQARAGLSIAPSAAPVAQSTDIFAPGSVLREPEKMPKTGPKVQVAPKAVVSREKAPLRFGGPGLPGMAPAESGTASASLAANPGLSPVLPVSETGSEPGFDFALAEQFQSVPKKPLNLAADNSEAETGLPLLPPLQFRNAIDYATSTEMPKVEELNDVMYEAEFWMSLNKIDNAIRLLEQYTISDQGSSPLPWLLLFDLYRKTQQNEQYMSLQRQFQRFFNGKIPDWEDYDHARQSIGLEAMGTLMARVETLWNTDEMIPFLESLLLDDRDGTREGFELGVYRDILFLCDLAKEVRRSGRGEKPVLDLAPLE